MKKTIQILCSCIITICLTLFLLGKLTTLMERKSSVSKYQDFYEQDAPFDVLFMGASHVINGIFPLELWHDYGIVSYNFGGHANQMATNYWVMKNALNLEKPKLMVLDCATLEFNIKASDSFDLVHLSLDAFPLSKEKIQTAFDLTDDPGMEERIAEGYEGTEVPRTKLELIWDYSLYHSRWTELTQEDFVPTPNVEKGAESRFNVAAVGEIVHTDISQKLEEETVGMEYLRKIIEECQAQNIELLLLYIPFPATELQQRASHSVYDIAEEYGVDYINFLDMDVVNYQTDCYDDNSHLNPSGARKVTDYIGKYIAENYDIADQRENPLYEDWKTDYEAYKEFKFFKFNEQEDLKNYLMLMADKNYHTLLDIRDASILYEDAYQALFENLGIDYAKLEKEDSIRYITIQHAKEASYHSDDLPAGVEKETDFGSVKLLEEPGDNRLAIYLVDAETGALTTVNVFD